MTSIVQEILEITQQLKVQLGKNPKDEEQEQHIANINLLLDKREVLLQQLPVEYTEQERALGQATIQLNQDIEILLQNFFLKIQKELRQVKNSMMVFNKYQKESSTSVDGMFFDKRK